MKKKFICLLVSAAVVCVSCRKDYACVFPDGSESLYSNIKSEQANILEIECETSGGNWTVR